VVPLSAVVPCHPSPRALRGSEVWAPGAVRRSCSFSESLFDISTDLFHSHDVTHGIDHSPDLGAIVLHHDVVGPLETERTQRVTLALTATDGGLVLSNFELCHQDFAPLSAADRKSVV